jgi:hypothetical protein
MLRFTVLSLQCLLLCLACLSVMAAPFILAYAFIKGVR